MTRVFRNASARLRIGDAYAHALAFLFGAAVVGLAGLLAWELWRNSALARHAFGFSFLVSQAWDPVAGQFGAAAFVYGTLMTSAIALVVAVPLGVFPLLLWGTEDERALAAEIREKTGVPFAPFLSIQETMALIAESALLVSGDTFALQMACALAVPVVGIFGPTNPRRNGPFLARDRVVYHEINCSLCYKRGCESLACMKAVTADEVAENVRRALTEHD